MRASRLLSILMHLQKGRVTAEWLSEELEVSLRTIYRDMDQLSLSGVPVYADRGRSGGFQLLEGWKMPSMRLNDIETEALLLSGVPDQVRQLGLQSALQSGQYKLQESLTENQKRLLGRISSSLYVDPVSWFGEEEPADKLQDIAEAVWTSRRVRCVYESWKGTVMRTLNPLGLIVKGGRWYLAAAVEGSERIYRVAKFKEIQILSDTFKRSSDFNLADFWRQAVARYEMDIYRATAQLRLTEEGFRQLSDLGSPVAKAADTSAVGPDARGFYVVSIPIENISQACSDILRLGKDCQVLAPLELVERVSSELDAMKHLYS